jgi:hypothetical protein
MAWMPAKAIRPSLPERLDCCALGCENQAEFIRVRFAVEGERWAIFPRTKPLVYCRRHATAVAERAGLVLIHNIAEAQAHWQKARNYEAAYRRWERERDGRRHQ